MTSGELSWIDKWRSKTRDAKHVLGRDLCLIEGQEEVTWEGLTLGAWVALREGVSDKPGSLGKLNAISNGRSTQRMTQVQCTTHHEVLD